MNASQLLTSVSSLLSLVNAWPGSPATVVEPALQNAWPYAPFNTSGRNIVNGQGDNVVYAGVNWPGAAETMLPEGLQYKSVSDIVTKMKSIGVNVIRLTYAIELIDDIYENNTNSALRNTLTNALGTENGTDVFNKIITKNPQFNENTTRLQVFDAVAEECYKQQIYVHLDNHMSRAGWCCNSFDGNAWFGDTDFNVANWTRGLAYMAEHGKRWPALVSMSLRNELRPPFSGSPAANDATWPNWYTNMTAGAKAINDANPSPLIFFSGQNFDTDLSVVVTGQDLGGGLTFNKSSLPYADKIVFELHDYAMTNSSCAEYGSTFYQAGYSSMDTSANTTAKNIAPMVMTEFGFPQDNSTWTLPYPECIKQYLTSINGGWMQWAWGGSYYIRQGVQDSDEPWGLITHDWSEWRSPEAVFNFTAPFINATQS